MDKHVSLDDLEKRMKKLEMNLKKPPRSPNLNLPLQQSASTSARPTTGLNLFSNGNSPMPRGSPLPGANAMPGSSTNLSRPSSGLELANNGSAVQSRNSPSFNLPLGQDQSKMSRPNSGLDLSSTGSNSPSRNSPSFGLSLGQGSNKMSRPSSGLDLSSSGKNSPAMQRKKKIAHSLPTQAEPAKNYESVEMNRRLQEVINQNGKLRIDSLLYKAVVSDFDNMGQIGAGTCGQVYKMKFKPANHIMAVKQMHRSGNSEESKRILMDLDVVQKSHDCPHIVTCYGTLITESHVWICMELMSTCFDKLLKKIEGPIPEKIVGKLTVAVVKALNYLKETQGVIHRDVKPSNILVDRMGVVKLCDFGISGRLVDSKAKTRSAGCVAYMAPERIDPPDPNRPDYDIRADVWSLGVSLVELATGKFPYQNCTTDFEVLTKVLQQDSPTLPQNLNFSIYFHQFVKLCCTKDYKHRPKYRELLEHNFIRYYERHPIDIVAWLNGVLNPAPPSHKNNPFHVPNRHVQSDDPFAFTAAATQAQFNQVRTGSGQRQVAAPQQISSNKSFSNNKVLTVDDLLS